MDVDEGKLKKPEFLALSTRVVEGLCRGRHLSPDDLRLALVLRMLGFKYGEIARVLGVDKKAVWDHVRRLRREVLEAGTLVLAGIIWPLIERPGEWSEKVRRAAEAIGRS